MNTRWQRSDAPRGAEYDARWTALAAQGQNIHGEAEFVAEELGDSGGRTVLDAGCGTGRVAIELARRGFTVSGVDADRPMLAAARAKAPSLTWLHGDLADPVAVGGIDPVDLVLLAGNVMIFLESGTEARVVGNLAERLTPGGRVVAGFSLRDRGLTLDDYDQFAAEAGLLPLARWATWDRQPFHGGDYAVSVHERPGR